jgi:hypothetical protein
MTALFSTRRRAEEFAAAVDGRSHDADSPLRDLVVVATRLRSHAADSAAVPRLEFSQDLRARLMAEAEHALAPHAPLTLPVRERGPRERRLVAAASVVVLVGGTAGMAAAAQDALPGEALYPIKRGLERAEAELSISTAGRGQDLLHQAQDRLAEVEGLLADGSVTTTPQVPATLEDFITQAQEGAGLLLTSYEETRDPAAVAAVRGFATEAVATLRELARTAPPAAQDELADAALALADIDRQAVALCDSCGPGAPLELPGVFLAAAEVSRVFTVVEGRLLDNSHPFVIDRRVADRVGAGDDTLADVDEVTGGGTTRDDDPDAPSGPETDDGPLIDLPDSDADVTNDDKRTKKLVDDTVGDITDGLTGVVETVLPDPDGLLD